MTAVGLVLPGQRQRPVGPVGHQALEPALAGQVEQDLGEVGVVLGDEEDAVALLDGAAVVGDRALDHRRQHRRARPAVGTGFDRLGLGAPGASLVRRRGRARAPAGPDRSAAGRA